MRTLCSAVLLFQAIVIGLAISLVIGVIAGYLMWAGRLNGAPEATSVVERLFGRQLGPEGRALVASAERIPSAAS